MLVDSTLCSVLHPRQVSRFPRLSELMDEAEEDVLAYAAFPADHWQKIWSNNPLERLNKEVKSTGGRAHRLRNSSTRRDFPTLLRPRMETKRPRPVCRTLSSSASRVAM